MSANSSYPTEKPLDGLECFYEEFLANREKEFQDLKHALVRKDYAKIAEVAHRWKGFCGPYGFGQLALIDEELERSALAQEDHKARPSSSMWTII